MRKHFYLASCAGFSYEVLDIYNLEKRPAVLENAAGFTTRRNNKMVPWGYVYTMGNKLYIPSNTVQVGLPPTLIS